MANTVKRSEVNVQNYDVVFYPGGHGPLWDLVSDEKSFGLIETFWSAGKPVSAVCHAPIVLAHTGAADGSPLVKGRTVTGFTNEEEDAVGLTEIVPLLVEDTIKNRGAQFSKVGPFQPHAVQDGRLITGQNPASSAAVARKVLEA